MFPGALRKCGRQSAVNIAASLGPRNPCCKCGQGCGQTRRRFALRPAFSRTKWTGEQVSKALLTVAVKHRVGGQFLAANSWGPILRGFAAVCAAWRQTSAESIRERIERIGLSD